MSSLDRLKLTLPDMAGLIEGAVEEAVGEALTRRQAEWVTTDEAGRRLGLSARAVRHAAKMGRLESKKIGRRTFVRL